MLYQIFLSFPYMRFPKRSNNFLFLLQLSIMHIVPRSRPLESYFQIVCFSKFRNSFGVVLLYLEKSSNIAKISGVKMKKQITSSTCVQPIIKWIFQNPNLGTLSIRHTASQKIQKSILTEIQFMNAYWISTLYFKQLFCAFPLSHLWS